MKKILLFLFFVFLALKSVQASEEVVLLESNTHFFYDNPAPMYEILEEVNNKESLLNDEKASFSIDEEFAESKIERSFCKFINNRIQNGRMNLITTPINY